uniref:Uncharacterized protein n=1 Tax=Myotis myotis TaxID=51298 RepID=A0A7J7TTU1_MYOMY|nr:hypothetical protein mMyoMyo1_008989 [Myotis myotis]
MWRKGNPSSLLVGMQTGVAIMESSMAFPQKIKYGTAIDPVIPLLGIYPKKPKAPIRKNVCIPVFIAAQFTIVKICKQSQCPLVDEWIKKLWDIYTMEYYTAIKRDLLPFETVWKDLESIMLSEISQSEKDKYHMISLPGGNLFNYLWWLPGHSSNMFISPEDIFPLIFQRESGRERKRQRETSM